jgi:hypothetical protein
VAGKLALASWLEILKTCGGESKPSEDDKLSHVLGRFIRFDRLLPHNWWSDDMPDRMILSDIKADFCEESDPQHVDWCIEKIGFNDDEVCKAKGDFRIIYSEGRMDR